MATTSFNWQDFLTLADELGQRADEAALRTALSRAYYFVYHVALNRAKQNGFVASRGEPSHVQLWRNFTASPDPTCRRLGEIATGLSELRRKADYEAVFPRIAEYIAGSLEDARNFSVKLVELPSRLPDPKSIRQ